MFNFRVHLLKGLLFGVVLFAIAAIIESGELSHIVSVENPYQAIEERNDSFAHYKMYSEKQSEIK